MVYIREVQVSLYSEEKTIISIGGGRLGRDWRNFMRKTEFQLGMAGVIYIEIGKIQRIYFK